MSRWLGLLALLSGCVPSGIFLCDSDADCLWAGVAGVCEVSPIRACSFPDTACAGSQRRFGRHAGPISHVCVGATALPDAGVDAMPDASGCQTCASAGAACGPISDGCGGTLECGTCLGPTTCSASACVATDWGTTYHVRVDGGSAAECDGTTDAPAAGAVNRKCAWKHPFIPLPPVSGARLIAAGDRLVIGPGEYTMGFGADGATACSAADTAACVMAPPPSGTDAEHPTRIVGAGYQTGCADPPVLAGTGGARAVVDLSGASHVRLDCLEITDRAACGLGFPAQACTPGGEHAEVGVLAAGQTGVEVRRLEVHGMASDGLRMSSIGALQIYDTAVIRNGGSGFSGWGNGTGGFGGVVRFDRFLAEGSGCVESYPAGGAPVTCAQLPAVGRKLVGHGILTGTTPGDWVITRSAFLRNTVNGVDLVAHTGGGANTIERSRFQGNAGYQIEVTGPTLLRNSVLVADCGYFEDKPYKGNVTQCLGRGNAFLVVMSAGQQTRLFNNTIYGEGDCLLDLEGMASVVARNNIFLAGSSRVVPGRQVCFEYHDPPELVFDNDHAVIWNAVDDPCPVGPNDLCMDPMLMNTSPLVFDARLKAGSPALHSGMAVTGDVPIIDIDGVTRPQGNGVDRGAHEQ